MTLSLSQSFAAKLYRHATPGLAVNYFMEPVKHIIPENTNIYSVIKFHCISLYHCIILSLRPSRLRQDEELAVHGTRAHVPQVIVHQIQAQQLSYGSSAYPFFTPRNVFRITIK